MFEKMTLKDSRNSSCSSRRGIFMVSGGPVKKYNDFLKGALSGLRQFLATESPLKMMKNAFYFTSKALFVLKIFKFLF